MIIVETIGNRERRYSDQNMMLRQVETGNLYEDAVDTVPVRYSYEETDIPLTDEIEAEIEDFEQALEDMGVRL